MPLKPPGILWWMASFLTFPPLLLTESVQTIGPWLCLAPPWWNTLPPICVSRAASVWAHFRLQRHGWWWTSVQCLDYFKDFFFQPLDDYLHVGLHKSTTSISTLSSSKPLQLELCSSLVHDSTYTCSSDLHGGSGRLYFKIWNDGNYVKGQAGKV